MSKDIRWFHSLTLNGEITNGDRPADTLAQEADAIFTHSLEGKSVLDIGAWDGYFSFEAERRGAERVLSTDYFCWSGPGWGTKAGYNFAHETLGSKNKSLDIDPFDLDPKALGTFNTVLFLGVLYHLTDPYGGLQKAADMADELLIVETVTAQNYHPEAVLQYYENDSLDGDGTNFFAPNTKALSGMLREIGFPRVEIIRNPASPMPLQSQLGTAHVAPRRLTMKERIKGKIKAETITQLSDPIVMPPDRDRHIAFAWRS
jgi:tRNA (mo5U34)-methyltransferase